MKYLALVALLQGTEAVKLDHQSSLTNQEKLFRVLENGDGFQGWHAGLSGFPGTENENNSYMGAYNRALPAVF